MSMLFFTHHLSDPTQFFGLKLWIMIVICIVLLIVTLLFVTLCSSSCRRRRRRRRISDNKYYCRMMDGKRTGLENQSGISTVEDHVVDSDHSHRSRSSIHVDMPPAVSGGGSGRCMTHSASEIPLATNGVSRGNMAVSVEHRVAYLGDKRARMQIFIKGGNVEGFSNEMAAVWGLRHNNLVKLIGSSSDGTERMLMYEYVDNGNLHQWLHQCLGRINPLTWNIRMGIILGITKGLAYLHEDSEPKIIHQRLKSTSILLDHHWNPKISDIGFTKLLRLEQDISVSRNHIALSGYIDPTCSYLDPAYVYTRNFDEKSDVYSFGVLVMEIISGRTPIRYNVSYENDPKEYLVDWLKLKVSNKKFDDIADPKLQEPPSRKELKRIVLIALRCVDPDIENRPTMSEILHMLEPRDLLLDDLQEPPSRKELKRIILIALRCVDPDIENRPTMGEILHMLEPRDLLLDDDFVIV